MSVLDFCREKSCSDCPVATLAMSKRELVLEVVADMCDLVDPGPDDEISLPPAEAVMLASAAGRIISGKCSENVIT